MDVWECDLVDVQSFAKYNDGYRYLLTVIDVFSKFIHILPLRVKTGKAVASVFLSVLGDKRYSKPIVRRPNWVRTDRGKEFLNRPFQEMLKKEGIEFQVCRDPNLKCAMVERSHRTIRDQLYKYFTHKNIYRYIDVLPKFVATYNDTVHGSTVMAPSKVGESDILTIWNKMLARQNKIKTAVAKFRLGQHVRISKEKMKFAKGGGQNYTTEIFKIRNVVHRSPRPVYELEDMLGAQIDGQFYSEELSPVTLSSRTTYKIDKILKKRRRGGILEYLVRGTEYNSDFDSWVPASSVKPV
jgi:hypothetical protein